MKKIEFIIKPYLLNNAKSALQELGIIGMTVSEIKNYHSEPPRPDAFLPDLPMGAKFEPCLKLEIVVDKACLDDVIDAAVGSGMVPSPSEDTTVQELEDVIRIRTREHGVSAI